MLIARHEGISLQARSPDGSIDDTSEADSLSPEKQAIIGAVVGGVAIIAITAGILFFLIKKHRWDQIRDREKALLALHAPPPAYDISDTSNSSRSSRKPSPSPLLPSVPVPISAPPASASLPSSYQCQVGRDIQEEQPPAYNAHSIPIYDPSRYHELQQQQQQQQFRPMSTLTINSGYLHYLGSNSTYGQRSLQLSMPFQGHRHTIQGMPGSHVGLGQGTASRSRSENSASHLLSAPVSDDGTRPPRKPKPVLSRLITNFG